MKHELAKKLYNDNWDGQYTTMEKLYERIRTLAENGGYQMCVYIDSRKDYNMVYDQLSDNGYDVEHYNGGNNNIIEVNWG